MRVKWKEMEEGPVALQGSATAAHANSMISPLSPEANSKRMRPHPDLALRRRQPGPASMAAS